MTLPRTAFIFVTILGAGACDKTTFSQVELTGPSCPDGQALVRPIVVQLRTDGGEHQEFFTGRDNPLGTPTTLSLPDDEHNYEARFGRCENEMTAESSTYTCGNVTWYEDMAVRINPTSPGASLTIPAPSDVSCTN